MTAVRDLDPASKAFIAFWQIPLADIVNDFLHQQSEKAFYQLITRLTCLTLAEYEYMHRQVNDLLKLEILSPHQWLFLGCAFTHGAGVPKDVEKAWKFYRETDTVAQKDRSVFAHFCRVFSFYLRDDKYQTAMVAREVQDCALNSFCLGFYYKKMQGWESSGNYARGLGLGDPKPDPAKCKQFFSKAAAQGFAPAAWELAIMLDDEHVHWLQTGAAMGDPSAFENLALEFYRRGWMENPINYVTAFQQLQTMATVLFDDRILPHEKGCEALRHVGDMYAQGLFVTKNMEEAMKLIEKSLLNPTTRHGFRAKEILEYYQQQNNEAGIARATKYLCGFALTPGCSYSAFKNSQHEFEFIMKGLFTQYPNNPEIIFHVGIALRKSLSIKELQKAYNDLALLSPDVFDRLAVYFVLSLQDSYPKLIDPNSDYFKPILSLLDEKNKAIFIDRIKARQNTQQVVVAECKALGLKDPSTLVGEYFGLGFFEEKEKAVEPPKEQKKDLPRPDR